MRVRRMTIARRHEGFTLLEVLVALAIMGMALVVVMQLFSANLRGLSVSESYVAAVTRAETLMRTVLDAEKLEEGGQSGTTEDGYRYEATITRAMESRFENTGLDLLQIKLVMSWNDGVRQRSITLLTFAAVERKL